ncbi:hypothetical protein [Streptomyces griseoloalbus]|uniref:NADPH-dependent FMN reductase n=1 Tax=Streptomyces griseoloalbus TaxID=67303 RepID=A0A7W8BTP7_9ACTN|nr:hypothetical protein [Streptomyces albaduncus]MBB5127484.1 hypothetical protein [Streptomyces albaduncus]GGW70479.1 hypothetical protein GCM10010340_55890 [Streptomyces albaduncus]
MTTPVVSIAHHSGFGHTAVLAEAVRAGAADTGAEMHLSLGVSTGAAAQTNVDEGPDAVHKAGIATAEHLGRRVARTAEVFLRGRSAVAA